MTVPSISVEEAQQLLAADKAVLIDVREQDEWDAAHVEGATLAPLSAMPQAWSELNLPTDKTVIVMCKAGGRSARVCQFVGEQTETGHPILNLEGGIMAWHQADLPLITG